MRPRHWLIPTVLGVAFGGFYFAYSSGLTPFRSTPPKVKYIKSIDVIKLLSEGLDEYKKRHGEYPSIPDFPSMVSAQSPLVKEGFIPHYVEQKDYWGNSYVGFSSSASYRIECMGDLRHPHDFPRYVKESR